MIVREILSRGEPSLPAPKTGLWREGSGLGRSQICHIKVRSKLTTPQLCQFTWCCDFFPLPVTGENYPVASTLLGFV
jgi:hypothetical protein